MERTGEEGRELNRITAGSKVPGWPGDTSDKKITRPQISCALAVTLAVFTVRTGVCPLIMSRL